MLSDVAMNNLSSVMANNKEAVQQVEGDRRDSEKIHGSDHFAMIAKKREPPFRGFRVSRRMTHAAGNGSLGNIETEHEKFTVNTRCAPGRIFRHHPEDQIPNFLGNSSSANDPAGSGNGLPIECESGPVPTRGLR